MRFFHKIEDVVSDVSLPEIPTCLGTQHRTYVNSGVVELSSILNALIANVESEKFSP